MARERPDRLADAVGAQCIPTPLAWFLHALPSVFLKLAVAATLLIELPAPFLLLAPFRAARLAGAALQAALQALIVLSGNYNFFNLLTGCLALTLLDDDVAWVSGRRAPRRPAGPAWTWTAFTALGPLGFVHAAVEGSWALGLAVVLGVLGAGAGAMFAFEAPAGPDGRGFGVALTLTSDALTGFVGRALLPVLYAWGVVLVLGTGADISSALGLAKTVEQRRGAVRQLPGRRSPSWWRRSGRTWRRSGSTW